MRLIIGKQIEYKMGSMTIFFEPLSLQIKLGSAYDRLNKVQQIADESAYINSYNGNKLPIAMPTGYNTIVGRCLKTLGIKMGIKNSKKATTLKITKNPRTKKNE